MSVYRQEFLICPWCGDESGCRIDHLYNDSRFANGFGPWHCKKCGRGIEGRVRSPGDVEVKRSTSKRTRSMVLLKLDGKDHPVWFIVDHSYHVDNESDEEYQSRQRYFFEEHSCPTNWLQDCCAVIEAGDCDPHGFLSFVRSVNVPQDFDIDDDNNWFRLFPEAFGRGPTIDIDPTYLGIENTGTPG